MAVLADEIDNAGMEACSHHRDDLVRLLREAVSVLSSTAPAPGDMPAPEMIYVLGRYQAYECPSYVAAFHAREDAEQARARIIAHLANAPDVDNDLMEKNGDEWDRQWNAQRAHFAACADDPGVIDKYQEYTIHEYPLRAALLPVVRAGDTFDESRLQ
jgi:hypothetical protein